MASVMRPGLVKQGLAAPAASQRVFSTFTSSSARQASPLVQQLRPAYARSALPRSARIAAFHATQRQQILPPLPQKIEGNVNTAVPVPNPDYTHGSYHWSFERIVSAGLVPLTVAPFAAGSLNPVTDSILCALLVLHSHIGFEYVSSTTLQPCALPDKYQVMHHRLLPQEARPQGPRCRKLGSPHRYRDPRCRSLLI